MQIFSRLKPAPTLAGQPFSNLCSILILAISLFFCFSAQAAEQPSSNGLMAKYPSIKAELEKNRFGIPIHLTSSEEQGSLRADVYGTLNTPFETVKETLQVPVNWCDIMPLHLNVKACTCRNESDQWLLTLYNGHKQYQSTESASELVLKFHLVAQQPDYLNITLSAGEGPLLTKDHRIRLEAAPLEGGRTFFHFSYAYSYGLMARMAIKSYFATIGHDKIGFTVVANDKNGKPVYLGGVRGALERNAVRYYLALQASLDTLRLPQDQQFERRISRWYDLSAKYPQLYEMDKEVYLYAKRREHANQLMLQKQAGAESCRKEARFPVRLKVPCERGSEGMTPSRTAFLFYNKSLFC